jgi:hypothetical protein
MFCERTKRGRPHYHLVGVMPIDCKTGVDFQQIAARNFNSLPPRLLAEWRKVRARLPYLISDEANDIGACPCGVFSQP